MKQSKQERARTNHEQGTEQRDSRPAKPAAGETAHHVAAVPPSTGPVKGSASPHGGTRVKAPFEPSAGGAVAPDVELPDQVPAGPLGAGRPGEGYVRLRVRVRGDRLSVIDSHLVEGPLSQTTAFHGVNAYDVTRRERLLHAGPIPDMGGTQRSFAAPSGPAEGLGHHLTSREVTEFAVRVPAHEVTAESIGEIRVRLHRVDEATRVARLGAAPLAAQLEGRATPVAELVGLPESVLPEAIVARGGRTASGGESAGPPRPTA